MDCKPAKKLTARSFEMWPQILHDAAIHRHGQELALKVLAEVVKDEAQVSAGQLLIVDCGVSTEDLRIALQHYRSFLTDC
jgi:hypothetical protein